MYGAGPREEETVSSASQWSGQEALWSEGTETGGALQEALDAIVARSSRMLRCEIAIVVVRNPGDPKGITASAARGLAVPRDGFGGGLGVSGEVLRSGEPFWVQDYQGYPGRSRAAEVSDLRAVLSVPISWDGAVRAALTVATRQRRRFSRRDTEALCELAALGGYALENAARREQLREVLYGSVAAFARAIDLRDGYTGAHSTSVARLARAVADRLGRPAQETRMIGVAALVHDLGKLGVPDAILHKDGPLDKSEWSIMRYHPTWGAELLEAIPALAGVAAIVRHSHERWDGAGYPEGLREEQIPLGSRIVFACDSYHAMTSQRPYRPALAPSDAVAELRDGAGTQFDPEVIAATLWSLDRTAHVAG
jgi:HD-GYP domain-containing protein (c-di-GMP phosphodiesterase class II)